MSRRHDTPPQGTIINISEFRAKQERREFAQMLRSLEKYIAAIPLSGDLQEQDHYGQDVRRIFHRCAELAALQPDLYSEALQKENESCLFSEGVLRRVLPTLAEEPLSPQETTLFTRMGIAVPEDVDPVLDWFEEKKTPEIAKQGYLLDQVVRGLEELYPAMPARERPRRVFLTPLLLHFQEFQTTHIGDPTKSPHYGETVGLVAREIARDETPEKILWAAVSQAADAVRIDPLVLSELHQAVDRKLGRPGAEEGALDPELVVELGRYLLALQSYDDPAALRASPAFADLLVFLKNQLDTLPAHQQKLLVDMLEEQAERLWPGEQYIFILKMIQQDLD